MNPIRLMHEVLASCNRPAQRLIRNSFGLLALSAVFAGVAGAQTIPLAVTSTSKVIGTVNGNAGHIAANTAGDLFYVSQGSNTAYWLPRGATTPIALMTGLQGARNISVDANNNVYVGNPYAGSATIIEDPYVNGTYATGIVYGNVPSCTSSTPTSPCVQYGSGSSTTNYYYQAVDVTFDGLGNTYVIDSYSNTNPAGAGKANSILKWSIGSGGTYVASYVSQILPQNYNAQIAAAPNGDVYYADGSNLYYIAYGTTTASIITTSAMTNPAGVSVDQYGDVFVTNSNTPYAIIEIPAVNGVAVLSKAFTFSQGYSANGIAFDQLGDYFYTGYSSSTNLNQARIYSFPLGSAVVGTPVSGTAQTINLLFTGTATPATIGLTGASPGFTYTPGSCAAGTTYSAGSSCNINVNYTPTAVGLQRGAVTLADATGKSLVSVYLSGIGLGAAQTSDPGTITAVGAGLVSPTSIRVDGSNNVYIADPGQNAVLRFAPGSTTPTSIGTGLLAPSSVAIDNSGNVFIADSGNARIVEVPNIGGTVTNSAQTVIATSYTVGTTSQNLGTTLAIALDPSGNLYVADGSKTPAVVRYASVDGVPNASQSSVVKGLTLMSPSALATDASGNLFIADTTANTVSEQVYYGKSILSIGSGYSHPSGLATDASGSLYVADSGNARLLKIPFESPIFNTNDQYRVDAGIAAPYGVALDAAANLYVVDNKNATASFLNRSQGTLALGRANLNSPTSTLNANMANAGNQALKFGTPAYVATGSTTVFTVTSPSPNGCTNGESVAPGYSCVLQASFDPTTTGKFSELLSFTSNALNTTTPSLTLTGQGLNLSPTKLTLTQVGTTSFGQPVVVNATISSTLAGTPTGTISFTVDGSSAGTYTVNGTTVQATLNGVTGGPHTIGASYTGDDNYAPSNTTLAITVVRAGSSVSLTAFGNGVNQNPASSQVGNNDSFQAIVTVTNSTTPTGYVTLTANGVNLGQSSIAPTGNLNVAVISTAALPAGTNTVIATYSGDVNYVPSSTSITVVVGPQTFTSTPAATNLTVSAHGNTGTTFQVVSLSGFHAYVGMSCTGLPANTTCGFSPNGFVLQADNLITAQQVVAGVVTVPATYGPTNVQLVISTGQTPTVPQPIVGAVKTAGPRGFVAMLLTLLALLPITLWLRKRGKTWQRATSFLLTLLALTTSITMFSGCGSNLVGLTPSGTYNVTVTTTATVFLYNGTGYVGTLAPGCSAGTTPTTPTCTQTSNITLVVQ